MSDAITPTDNSSLNQTDYLKLFMQELTYQDPLKPMDNKEFMAQMAKFSSLQVAQENKDLLGQLLGMTSANQALTLLGRTVRVRNASESGTVNNVTFSDNEPPKLQVSMKGSFNTVLLNDIEGSLLESVDDSSKNTDVPHNHDIHGSHDKPWDVGFNLNCQQAQVHYRLTG